MTTEDDVAVKRDQARHLEEDLNVFQQKLDQALEKNSKLTVFRQASAMAQKKLRDKEEEFEKLNEEKKKLQKILQDKENLMESQLSANSGLKAGKVERMKMAEGVKEKQIKYTNARSELDALRAEVVTLQRTENILKIKFLEIESNMKLDQLIEETEKKRRANVYTIF